MNGSNFMQGWVTLTGTFAIVALALMALGIMLGIVKPADDLKRIGVIISVIIVLMLLPGILVSVWSALYLWQQIGLVAIGVCVWQLLRMRRQTSNK
jgi:hypothetical protein